MQINEVQADSMHSDSGSDRFDNCIAELGGLAIPTFRLEFETDPQFRIENFLPTLETWLNNFPSDVRQDVKNLVVADLLFNEMELRFKAGQRFGTAEYELRFPAFASRIRLAISNLTRKYPDFIESHSIVALTRAQIDEDDGTGSENTFRHAGIGEHDRQIPQSLGPYVSIVPIKTGGFGAVCKAVDQRDQRVVALKFPRGGRLRRKSDLKTFVAEADKAMSLDHPGIVRTIAVEKADGLLAIVQEFIEGGDLKSTDNRPRSHREIVELIAMVADALDYAHRKGIYHRDLKPGNILVDVNGRPYIADFGLALDERDQLFSPSQRCGTTHYMAPELVAGLTRRVDGRSDIWSLGVIFYELLTNRKPFDGVTEEDVYDQIEHKDPRPPRQIDASIDRELQRICLKCLERQQRDRYSSADELADDLRHWMHRSLHVRQPSDQPKFVPKGLKSYTAEDAAFFLDLLPGPRDRYGLPDSIRFWKKRISNANDSESCVPIGVIFGPSGSGKSSYVKAGLMPQLPDDILSIYLEANQVDTETRLLRELRKRIPDIPANLSLPATMQGLALGQWLPAEKRKVLIVIDQFEQRLAMADDIAVSRLVKALRYCDGEVLQCLVLARDDFLMALSRFMDALEMDLKEGENAQAIDLFDRRHACKVLEKLGRAYDKLPTDPSGISEEQQRFLDVAIDQLIQDEHVICVHLTMFAEMFRHRPWTLLELDQVGGVSGTGEKFLEATFGANARDKRWKAQRENVQRVLETLLPAVGSDIRGAMKSEHELLAASGMEADPPRFREMMHGLDTQLKLITRTDPDLSRSAQSNEAHNGQRPTSTSSTSWFQLTHDYLVPSIRKWLENTLGMTRAGRARLRLRDIGNQVMAGQPVRVLPTLLEWLSWYWQVPHDCLTANERLVMATAKKRFFWQFTAVFAVLLLIMGAVMFVVNYNHRQQTVERVDNLIENLLHQDIQQVPQIVRQLQSLPAESEPRLRSRMNMPDCTPRDEMRLAMGLLPFDPSMRSILVDAIVSPECDADRLRIIVDMIHDCHLADNIDLVDTYLSSSVDPRLYLRVVGADVLLRRGNGDWSKAIDYVISGLSSEPLSTVNSWVEILEPAGEQFVAKLEQRFDDIEDVSKALAFVKGLYRFLPLDQRLKFFANKLKHSDHIQFNAILSIFEESEIRREFLEQLSAEHEALTPNTQELKAMSQVNLALAQLRLGLDKPILQLYAGDLNQPLTLLAINASTPERINWYDLVKVYRDNEIQTVPSVNLRRSVLQALTFHVAEHFDTSLTESLTGIARYHVESDPDACCFSTSELLLRRLGERNITGWREVRRQKTMDGILGNVLIDAVGGAYVIIEHRDPENVIKRFAMATTEVSDEEIARFLAANGIPAEFDASDLPFQIVGFSDYEFIFQYCNWLTRENGMATHEYCYPELVEPEHLASTYADLTQPGYRLPTSEEWILANRLDGRIIDLFIDSQALYLNYAWLFESAFGNIRPVGQKLPNSLGIFDGYGNVQEMCEVVSSDNRGYQDFGRTARGSLTSLRVPRVLHDVESATKNLQGIRIIRGLF